MGNPFKNESLSEWLVGWVVKKLIGINIIVYERYQRRLWLKIVESKQITREIP